MRAHFQPINLQHLRFSRFCYIYTHHKYLGYTPLKIFYTVFLSISHFSIDNPRSIYGLIGGTTRSWKKIVEIETRKYRRCLNISNKIPQKLFTLVLCLTIGALDCSIPSNNPHMLCGLDRLGTVFSYQ